MSFVSKLSNISRRALFISKSLTKQCSSRLIQYPGKNLRSVNMLPGVTSVKYMSIDSDSKSSEEEHEFQAETKMLLDIVARSLYSENEVFIRELISNASDALEKFRYIVHTSGEMEGSIEEASRPLEIHITTDKQSRILTIRDSGVGMNKDELIKNLGTIASSGSKYFLEEIKNKSSSPGNASNIIGQFGVGFYSAFMVADKVEVFTKSFKSNDTPLYWTSSGDGSFKIKQIEDGQFGTKIVIHLKPECREFCDEDRIKAVIKKYSNFVGSPIYLNGKQINEIQPLWLKDPSEVTQEQHNVFFRFIGNSVDSPRFILHYKTDVPISIRALLYFPEGKPGLFELTRDGEFGVSLYARKILIQSKTESLIPKWLRFVKGVVDSEDIPLNLSRELLQNSVLIKKISNVLTSKIISFLHEMAKKKPSEYIKFYEDYGLFLKEGIISSQDLKEKENIAKLLLFESSSHDHGTKVSLEDYCKDTDAAQSEIYYLAAPNRTLAEASPYYESLKKKKARVLFCYEPYDELVLMQLAVFRNKKLVSVEKEMRSGSSPEIINDLNENSLKTSETDDLLKWLKLKLSGKVDKVKVTNRLETHPCVITVEEMAAARHFIRTQSKQIPEDQRFALLQPQLDINPKHAIIKKLYHLKKSNPLLADLLAEQLFINALVGAGLADDPRILLNNMNELLIKALEKH